MTSAILGRKSSASRRCRSSSEKHGSNHIIEHKDQDRGRNDRISRRLTDALSAIARIVAVIAAHQRDDEPEHRRLHQSGHYVYRLEVLVRAVEVGLGIKAEPVNTNQISAKDTDDV